MDPFRAIQAGPVRSLGGFRRMAPSEHDDSEALLIEARAGNGAALGWLLERYRNYLALLARYQIGRRLQRKVDPADIIQETFLAAFREIGQFRGETEGEFLAWLRTILSGVLANQVRHYLGTKRRDVRLEREMAADLDRSSHALELGFVASQSSPSRSVARRELAVLLADALGKLPEDYREVIILRQLEDLSFPQVAERMDRSQDSVKNLWARALARLRNAMDDPR